MNDFYNNGMCYNRLQKFIETKHEMDHDTVGNYNQDTAYKIFVGCRSIQWNWGGGGETK